jgi:hypothetical protein
MPSFSQLLTDLGNAIEGARAHITSFEQQHIGTLREIATQAESVAAAGARGGPEAMVVDLVATALDDLKQRVEDAFAKKPPAAPQAATLDAPASDPTPAPGPF